MDHEFRNECQTLLIKLKSTVEVLLGNQSTNVWNTYGGLSRLTNVVSSILKHRLKRDQGEDLDCWNFIMGLRVLMPTITPWLERHRLATEGSSGRCHLWLQQLLQEHTLSTYLKILLDDHNHIRACYHVGAFLRQEEFGESLLTCLKAVENNQLELLAQLDTTLLADHMPGPRSFVKSPSLPNNVSTFAQHYHSKDVSPFVTTCYLHVDNRPHQDSVVGSGQLHRACPVNPSMGEYYRERCISHQVPLKTDNSLLPGTSSSKPLPKSCTWDSALSWDHVVSVIRQQEAEKSFPVLNPRIKLHSYTSCGSLYQPPGETSPSFTSDSLRILRDSKSLPCIHSAVNDRLQLLDKNSQSKAKQISFANKNGTESSVPASELFETESIISDPVLPANAQLNPTKGSQNIHRSPSHTRSKSDIGISRHAVVPIHKGEVHGYHTPCNIPMSSSLPTVLPTDQESAKLLNEEYTTPIFRRPMEGQSLTSFLSSQDFRTCAELDKENAHFSISEALIAAIEQIKCNQMRKIAEEQDEESDDEEIKHLKQRIRIRRRERLQEKVVYQNPQLLSDGCTDTATTSQSPSPRSTSSDNKSEENTSDSIDQIDLSEDGSEVDSKLSTLHESGLSLSMASLYSDADIHRPAVAQPPPQDTLDKSLPVAESPAPYVSAESVALNLLRKFSEKQLPKASDLEWLVSEQDAPQKLLPMPTSWPVSPDDAENINQSLQTRLRGNLEWAPPRQQIIFNVHPTPQRKVIMAKQNYRCTGCGTKVEQGFMKRFRYCEYLGKYFCQCCHNNNLAYIPGRILRKWDFNKYYVSNFSRDLLYKMCADPLYDINNVNPSLYRRVKVLHQVHQYRLQLYHIKDFIRVCRNCVSLAEELDKQPNHLFNNPHLYSLIELVQVKNGEMMNRLKPMVAQTLAHVSQCQLCQARGFFCEFCKNDKEIIFPFQLGKVSQCPACWSCYHSDCFVPSKCPKCFRIEARKQQLLQIEENSELL